MEYVYAALLIDTAGKEINEKNLLEVIKSAGFTPDEAKAKAIVESLKDVNIKEILKSAENMQTVASPSKAKTEEPKAEHKEAAKDEEKSSEEAATGLAGLFG